MEEHDKITLVCTSLGKHPELLKRMLDSAKGFDDVLLYKIPPEKYLSIPNAYNFLIDKVKTQWVCCMPDDDYFYPDGLSKMIDAVHNNIYAGVAHFKFHISGYMPSEDTRGQVYKFVTGKTEYDLCEKKTVTYELLRKHNRLPAASFFRKIVWEKIGGFQGDKYHDWNFWKRAAQWGAEFKYFDYLVYNFVRREGSAWEKQNKS